MTSRSFISSCRELRIPSTMRMRMHIEQTRVMSGDRILQAVPSGTTFRVVVRASGISASSLERAGTDLSSLTGTPSSHQLSVHEQGSMLLADTTFDVICLWNRDTSTRSNGRTSNGMARGRSRRSLSSRIYTGIVISGTRGSSRRGIDHCQHWHGPPSDFSGVDLWNRFQRASQSHRKCVP